MRSGRFRSKKHLFFDLDMTIAPSRQPILPSMYELVQILPHSIVIVSGQEVSKIAWQTKGLVAFRLGQNGNHATCPDGAELWNIALSDADRAEILAHIDAVRQQISHEIREDWVPIEDRGAQITFSPIGNNAPNDIKAAYDPDRRKRIELLRKVPFESKTLTVKIGGSTSFDYIHRERHKGVNVKKLIDQLGWEPDECIYFGDGLFPGGNDEAVIGTIDTVAVRDHLHTYDILKSEFF